ncbi:hormogonium polysaccharide secretion pseudopilin HpsB [Limnoraphis robusta]|uniref:Hormogonium polysaccharide secretion pseudopilin HpsB n=1 Tax=Limnoraphis robusta CCNP1315 TaxID=3110306 RepID=A0ABU5U796_9CYAN|nr:hormogonium polysaccharide secretion pseudopilin HpsB [Limnoraphis robusta]MEA5500118.1 hormogonium polysaccharide secretion pseudopilin HpsB [Limnoraphis robusta BA-68 BA1]MEA5522732.1 hormogonium polysaccharide secretion pseudopilin HpsB [Limnoraphis robusta CCNP1315]MEA5543810.1 hormogonium polysaccharide secretion pseudopilin HpsB [Limnoraphis robusta CCNP1324]
MILLKPKPQKSSESGYSLIESLIAIIIVSILMVSVAPMIALSVGTRAQAKRLELASQAGKAYVDFLRANSGNVTEIVNNAPGNTTNTAPTQGDFVADKEGYVNNTNKLYCVNFDENAGCQSNSLVDMLVQPVQLHSVDPKTGYNLLVRVYRADAFSSGQTLKKDGQNSAITNAIGDRTAPMVQFSTSISSVNSSGGDKYKDTNCRINNKLGISDLINCP